MITKAVINLDPIKPEIYFIDRNNQRVSQNIQIAPKTTASEIKTMADKTEKEIRRKEIENRQGSLNL
ncbi:hypothetical protein [Campylobacter californiensis]|uniref:hypothetical protein n=1 Tax=Campylobacter californiensis TaxID=1032243 RepID=UPI00147351B1|nr:hypothetical protein [Campylobacter sp. RM12916]MBE3610502.1 hypothetical protein [Campylobacter sp. RM12916]